MVQLNKFHLVVAFLFLAALRISIGFHFFDQGHQKYREGGFDSTGFLKSARGPFAPLFHSAVPDHDGKIRLCYEPLKEGANKIDPKNTLAIWETYKNYVIDELIKEEGRLVDRRERTKTRLENLDPSSEEYLVENKLYQRDEETILAIRKSRQRGDANRIFNNYKDELRAFLANNEEEINYYFQGEDRLDGFQRDYEITNVESVSDTAKDTVRERRMKSAAKNVGLLRDQIKDIESDRQKALNGWLATVDDLWSGFEYELLNMVQLDDERKKQLALEKPSESATISMINRWIPYFDMTVGTLLILGLFTRIASFAAGTFLLSILMSQPAILGEAAAPTTILYLIEMLAAFVVFATCAGRYAGLDYFIHAGVKRLFKTENEDFV